MLLIEDLVSVYFYFYLLRNAFNALKNQSLSVIGLMGLLVSLTWHNQGMGSLGVLKGCSKEPNNKLGKDV